MALKRQSQIQLPKGFRRESQADMVGCGINEMDCPLPLRFLCSHIGWISTICSSKTSAQPERNYQMNSKVYQKMKKWEKCIHGCIWVCVCSVTCLFLAVHHFAASLLNENWKHKCEIPHIFSPFGLCGSHACFSGALHWCVCMWVCVMCREGALHGLDFFFPLEKTPQKPTKQMGLFLVVYASSKLQSRSTRL